MLCPIKEKSWSVFLVNGTLHNGQVRAERCTNCKSSTEILTLNHHNPNLILYACKNTKCKHHLLRLDINQEITRQTHQQAA